MWELEPATAVVHGSFLFHFVVVVVVCWGVVRLYDSDFRATIAPVNDWNGSIGSNA